jgi:hypothetical protein
VVTATTVVDPALLERRISADRLAPYKLAVGGDLAAALDLYQWNAELSAAFWVVLGHLEILVRNVMHEQLIALSVSRRSGPDWYLALAGDLSSEACATIADARRHATAINPGPVDTGWMTDDLRRSVARQTPLGRLGTRRTPPTWSSSSAHPRAAGSTASS